MSYLNRKVIDKKDSIKGFCLFADEPIPKGEIIMIFSGEVFKYKEVLNSSNNIFKNHCFQIYEDLVLCPIDTNKNKTSNNNFESIDKSYFMNHSCDANCGFFGQICIVAMKDIEKGEELTFDYAMSDSNYPNALCDSMNCLCGTKSCRKIITGDDWKRKDLQDKYKGYFSSFIQKLIDNLNK